MILQLKGDSKGKLAQFSNSPNVPQFRNEIPQRSNAI
jgi:hypothetical protein